jgi:hypothetical protein
MDGGGKVGGASDGGKKDSSYHGRDSDALAILDACVQLRNQQLGSNHPQTISATATLNKWRILTEKLQPLDQPQKPRKRDMVKKLFRRK